MHEQTIIVQTEQCLSKKGAETQPNKFIPNGSILVACIGAKLGVVSLTSETCQTNQQINAVIPHNDRLRYYSFFALTDLKPLLQAMGGGATMPNVNKTKFSGLPVLLPSSTLLTTFNETVHPIFSQIRVLQLLNIKLKSARDLLLPRLMNGEIEV
jgi:type I restriction enzyme, S subunit